MNLLEQKLYGLIEDASTNLPSDVEAAIQRGLSKEVSGTPAASALEAILENIAMARVRKRPICQDTGTIIFHVDVPEFASFSQRQFIISAKRAVVEATKDTILRQNSVCPLSGKNSGDNLGQGAPVFHFHEYQGKTLKVTLLLKGGGSENVGVQYALPDKRIGAGRDLDGVRKCILDAVVLAQGKGCAPGILSVVAGGDRATGFEQSKVQLMRKLGTRSSDPVLAELEVEMLKKANSLGIGPMGLGGETTLLDVFVSSMNRVPASYFVSVSYMCWAFRRHEIEISLEDI